MTTIKAVAGLTEAIRRADDEALRLGLLLTLVVICDSQFLTPDQLREQHDLGYGARTHYEMSGSRRTDMFNRVNPDYLLRGRLSRALSSLSFNSIVSGFFPFWSIVLIALALVALTVAVMGLIGYLLGCRRPTPEELYASEFQQITPDDEFLLGEGAVMQVDETKPFSNGHYGDPNADFPYKPSPPTSRTRIGQSDEDMV